MTQSETRIDPYVFVEKLPEYSILRPFRIEKIPHESGLGFRYILFEDKTFVASINVTHVVNFDESPEDEKAMMVKNETMGIHTFMANIAVNEAYRGKGIGQALWILVDLVLLSTYPSFLESVSDASGSGWAERTSKKVIDTIQKAGYKAEIVWNGKNQGFYEEYDSKLIMYANTGNTL